MEKLIEIRKQKGNSSKLIDSILVGENDNFLDTLVCYGYEKYVNKYEEKPEQPETSKIKDFSCDNLTDNLFPDSYSIKFTIVSYKEAKENLLKKHELEIENLERLFGHI